MDWPMERMLEADQITDSEFVFAAIGAGSYFKFMQR
jgi:hypothetical protein